MDITETIFVTPSMAEEWLTRATYRGQRPIIRRVVERYKNLMISGEWGLGESAIVIGRRIHHDNTLTAHLLNGQQRLTALKESGLSFKFLIDYRDFYSDQEMDDAYAVMDGGAKRTLVHRIDALDLSNITGTNRDITNKAIRAIKLIVNNFGFHNGAYFTDMDLSPKLIHKLASDWSQAIYAYNRACDGATGQVRRALYLSPVMAMGLITYRFCPERAEEFWPKVASNEGLFKGSPEHAMFSYLLNITGVSGRQYEKVLVLAAVWNAHFDRREISKAHALKTLTIKGTPYKYDGEHKQFEFSKS